MSTASLVLASASTASPMAAGPFGVMTDVTQSTDQAMRAIAVRPANTPRAILDASHDLTRLPFTGAAILVADAILTDQPIRPAWISEIDERATPIQRKAFAVRLKNLSRARPDRAGVINEVLRHLERQPQTQ